MALQVYLARDYPLTERRYHRYAVDSRPNVFFMIQNEGCL